MHLINSNLFLNGVFKWDKKINRNIDLYFCETVLKTKIVCLKSRDDVFPMRLEDWLLVIFPEARPCGNYLCLSNIISDYRSVKWDIKTLVAMRFASDQTQISTICSLQWFPIQSSNPLLFFNGVKAFKKRCRVIKPETIEMDNLNLKTSSALWWLFIQSNLLLGNVYELGFDLYHHSYHFIFVRNSNIVIFKPIAVLDFDTNC